MEPEQYDVGALPPSVLEALEADSFWCLSKLLDGIQDNYIFAQPGIQRQVARMKELCSRVDGESPFLLAGFMRSRCISEFDGGMYLNCKILAAIPTKVASFELMLTSYLFLLKLHWLIT